MERDNSDMLTRESQHPIAPQDLATVGVLMSLAQLAPKVNSLVTFSRWSNTHIIVVYCTYEVVGHPRWYDLCCDRIMHS